MGLQRVGYDLATEQWKRSTYHIPGYWANMMNEINKNERCVRSSSIVQCLLKYGQWTTCTQNNLKGHLNADSWAPHQPKWNRISEQSSRIYTITSSTGNFTYVFMICIISKYSRIKDVSIRFIANYVSVPLYVIFSVLIMFTYKFLASIKLSVPWK